MTLPDFTADLPAPRDDEPSSLRTDIVDELSDHLQCAVRREELIGGAGNDSRSIPHPGPLPEGEGDRVDGGPEPRRSTAYQRALARFGNPAAVARNLWWDHMWEKIMRQRLMAAGVGLIAVCAIGALIVAVLMLDQMRTLLADSQAVNAALIDRLERQPESPGKNYDWCDFQIKLVQDRRDGPPMTAAKVVLMKLGGGATDESRNYPSRPQQPDADGNVDFSPVPYGYYYLLVRTDSGDLFKEEIAVHPGRAYKRTIVCPVSPPTGQVVPAAISTAVSAPDELQGRLWTLLRVYQPWVYSFGLRAGDAIDPENGGTRLAGDRWILANVQAVLISPQGDMYPVDWPSATPQTDQSSGATANRQPPNWFSEALQPSFSVAAMPESMPLMLPAGEYTLDWELVLLSATPDAGQAATWTLLDDETRSRIVVNQENESQSATPVVTAAETTNWPLRSSGYGHNPQDGFLDKPVETQEFPDHMTHPSQIAPQLYDSFGGGGGFGGGGFF